MSMTLPPPGMPGGPSVPPPLPSIPNLVPPGMRPTGAQLGSEQALLFLRQRDTPPDPADSDGALPPQLRRYAAGLRAQVRPTSSPWQQEIIYEALGKDDGEIETAAKFYLQNAQSYDASLSEERVRASEYYSGLHPKDAPKGRSQLVMSVVRDTIRATLPSLLRIFTGVEHPVVFEPVASEILANDQLVGALSKQATDYASWALFTANPGWQIIHDALLEALTRKSGWVRWRWGKLRENRTEVCEGLLLPQLQLLLAEPGIEAQRIVRRPMTRLEALAVSNTPDGQMYLQQGGPPEYWSATITRTAQQSWPVVEAVPARCVWVDPQATSVSDAKAVFHVRLATASELIEAGLPEDKVLAAGGSTINSRWRTEAIARDPATGNNVITSPPPNDRSMRQVLYAEGWMRLDVDNDNRAELIHVHMLGDAKRLVKWERCDEIPLACFTPYREPNQIIGSSQADYVMDLQRIETRVMRAVLDSLSQSMFPRTVAVLGQVNEADVRQTAIGTIIRVSQPGAVSELTKPFMGKEALPVLEVLEAVRESRTGITRASAGLTIDELQSTAPIAISQQTSNSQDRLDMMARTLAETGLAPLYLGLLKMMCRQQDRPNVIRIRGQWISIDPRALATMWVCSVNVGGRGTTMERVAMLGQIAQKQEQIMLNQGLQNPLVGVPEYRNTLARLLETANIADVSNYFKALPPDWQPPPPNQQPTADQLLAAVQQQKTAADLETDRGKAQTERAKMLAEDERERDKAALDAYTRTWVAAAQFGTPAPSLPEFRMAMRNPLPNIGQLPPVPPPTSPIQPATGVQSVLPQGGAPPRPNPLQPPPGAPMGPRPPTMPPRPNAMPDPATQLAVRNGLAGRGLPTAYGQIATRAALAPLMGPGGPSLQGQQPPTAGP